MAAHETIFAIATAPGRAGVAVVRISGPSAINVITHLAKASLPPEWRTVLCRIRDPETDEVIDRGLLIWFPSPKSFTGEDVVELHTHGGHAVTAAVVAALSKLAGFRLAEPGEFSRRAFENGKLDLTEAEAIADLVNAETEAQRKQALRQMEGALGSLYERWRSQLLRSLAYLEAAIDFAEDDLPHEIIDKETTTLKSLVGEIRHHLDDDHRGERLREGFSIAILGAPNSGKSSLLNALARRDVAIVSTVAGTTRDIIEIHLDLGGYAVTLADTAGLRDSSDIIENEGMRRALKRAEQADLKVLVFDGAKLPELDETTRRLRDPHSIVVVNKSDLLENSTAKLFDHTDALTFCIPLSAQTGEGIPQLLSRMLMEIEKRLGDESGPPLTRARHRQALEEVIQNLERAETVVEPELRAEDVRLAARALGRITGRMDVEDLLDVIFRDFCIGK